MYYFAKVMVRLVPRKLAKMTADGVIATYGR